MHHSYFTHVLHATTISFFFLTATKVSLILIRGFKSLNWTLMVLFKLLDQSCGLLGCWVVHLSSTYGQNTAARKARSVSLQCQQRSCSVTYIHLAEVEWHSWTSHAASDQMSTLVAVFLQAARGASGWAPAGQMGRQCVVLHWIVGSEECLQRFLPEPNRGPDVQKRKAQWSTSGERITSWAHLKSFPADTQGFRFVFVFFFIPKATPHLNYLGAAFWSFCL